MFEISEDDVPAEARSSPAAPPLPGPVAALLIPSVALQCASPPPSRALVHLPPGPSLLGRDWARGRQHGALGPCERRCCFFQPTVPPPPPPLRPLPPAHHAPAAPNAVRSPPVPPPAARPPTPLHPADARVHPQTKGSLRVRGRSASRAPRRPRRCSAGASGCRSPRWTSRSTPSSTRSTAARRAAGRNATKPPQLHRQSTLLSEHISEPPVSPVFRRCSILTRSHNRHNPCR